MARSASSKRAFGAVVAFVVALPVLAIALPARISWNSGDRIVASEINENFKQLWDAVAALEGAPIRESLTIDLQAADGCAGLKNALASLDGRSIVSTAEVIIELAPATYACSTTIMLQHPYGDRIRIRGTGNMPSQVVLSFPADIGGITVRSHPFGGIENLTLEGAGKGVGALGEGVLAVRGGSLHLADVVIRGFRYGAMVAHSSALSGENVSALDNTDNGFISYAGTLVLVGAVAQGNGSSGFFITDASRAYVESAVAVDNGDDGFLVTGGAYLDLALSSAATDNEGSGFHCRNHATLILAAADATGNAEYGYKAATGGVIQRATAATAADNILGATLPATPDTLSANGAIIIDAAD